MPIPCPEFELIIIGAGISGLKTANRLQQQFPEHKYATLEARASIGGAWDIFVIQASDLTRTCSPSASPGIDGPVQIRLQKLQTSKITCRMLFLDMELRKELSMSTGSIL